ncbi:hypothetical protein [Candidatus Protochlamydia naegleriophila]|nr:hypothetical protein [Candidatus Protochlamydia naegleriophila]
MQIGIHFLNQPLIKDWVKNAAGSMTCVFALVEFYTICQIIKGREISITIAPQAPKWMQRWCKTTIICAKISLILSAIVSRPGTFVISTLIHSIFSTAQLETVFGPNTIFNINPWHPRHIISLIALALAFPIIAQSCYQGMKWTYKKMHRYLSQRAVQHSQFSEINTKVKLAALFSTLTGRPVLHIGNQLALFLLHCI